MQSENQTLAEVHKEQDSSSVDSASLYRTKWLMAHNRLHAVVHGPSASLAELWSAYLGELQSAEEVAQQPA
jgi:hypothetical protein